MSINIIDTVKAKGLRMDMDAVYVQSVNFILDSIKIL